MEFLVDNECKKSVAVWQPYFRGGGAEAVSLWILQALSRKYDLTLYTLSEVDFFQLDATYNTQLAKERIKVVATLPKKMDGLAYLLIAISKPFRSAFIYWTIRHFKRDASQYDAVFSTFNAIDMGCPGIQYLHWVKVVENNTSSAKPWLKKLMNWVDFSYERLEKNYSIANSSYTAEAVKKCYGIESTVIFPPVTTNINVLPWTEKRNAFLCSGRIVAAKQTHRVINILKKVRDRGFDVQLHITGGGAGNGIYPEKYLKKVKSLAEENSEWIYLHQDLPYQEYLKILSDCRYGIHYKPEPFGISVAEMLKAGIIPFVRPKGGQMEIVGAENPEILFDDEADAVEKIIHVLSEKDLQIKLLNFLEHRKSLFSTETFMKEIQAVVDHHFS
ncbi:MAG: glycosyltransferase [Cyanobacteria bacterium P01_D01_bin.36]